MSIRAFSISLFLLLGFQSGFSQIISLQEAENLTTQGEYEKALEVYDNLDILNDSKAIFYKGYCLYKIRSLEKAENHFLAAHNLGYDNYQLYFLMGQLRQAEGDYDEATRFYKQAFKKSKKNSPTRSRIINALNSCSNAEKIEFQKSGDVVINLGDIVNSAYDESYPLPSPTNEGLIYFSSKKNPHELFPLDTLVFRQRNAEIYKAKIKDNLVLGIDFANPNIRSEDDEYLLDITENGQVLFFLQDGRDKKIYTDTFITRTSQKSALSALGSVIRTDDLRHVDIIKDSIFIYPSDRPGGYGGYDLYFSVKRNDTWLEGINMGPIINGPFDEISPYMTRDCKRLFFSSNRDGGLGGFDVYKSDYSDIEKNWTTPKNAKIPINSSQDDIDFKISLLNPKSALLASNRLLNNLGGMDIYEVLLGEAAWNSVSDTAPGFFTEYMSAHYTEKTFVAAKNGRLLDSEEEIERAFAEDSIRLAELERLKIQRQQEVMDSIAMVLEIKEQQRIQDSLILVQVEEERIRRQQFIQDSLLQIQIEKERIAEELRIQDSIAVAKIEEEKRLEEERIERERIRDSIRIVRIEEERLAAEKRRQDSIEFVRLEILRKAQEQKTRDSLALVQLQEEKRKREQEIRDSINLVRLMEIKRQQEIQDSIELARLEEVRRMQEQKTRDSLELVRIEELRLLREQKTRDSLALVQLQEEQRKREQEIQDSINLVRLMEIKRQQEIQDSIELARLEEVRRIQEQKTRDSLELVRIEELRLLQEQKTRDSLAVVAMEIERRAREQFVQDSLEMVSLEKERLERIRIEQDSLDALIAEQDRLREEARIQDSISQILPELDSSVLEPLVFHTIILERKSADGEILTDNEESVEILKTILNNYPNALAEIEGFYQEEGPSKVYDLFESIKLAEELKNALISEDIKANKVSLKGHGYDYNDTTIVASSPQHQKILIRVFNTDLAGYIPNPEEPLVNEDPEGRYYDEYIASVKGLHFRIEAIQIKRMLANQAIQDMMPVMLEQAPESTKFSYLFGLYDDVESAILGRRELIQYNFKNPKIIAYLNGSRISEQQARFMVDEIPELEAYIRFLDNGQ